MKKRNSEDFLVSGTNIEDFKEEVKKMSEITHVKKVKVRDFDFMHVQGETATDFHVVLLNNAALFEGIDTSKQMALRHSDMELSSNEIATNLLAITSDDTDNEDVVAFSTMAIPSLFQNIGLSGSATISANDIYRNAHFACEFYKQPATKSLSLVYRQSPDTNDKKVYYVGRSRYNYVPQAAELIPVLDRIYKEKALGEIEAKEWYVDSALSHIYLEFPDEAQAISESYGKPVGIPGMILQTSDVGVSSLTAMSTLRIKNNIIILESVSKQHCKKDGENFVDAFYETIDNSLFANVRVVPEQLAKLFGTYLPKDDIKREELIYGAIEKIFPKVFKVDAKRRQVLDLLMTSLEANTEYSYFDVFVAFTELPERLECDTLTSTTIQKLCAKLPGYLVEKI